MALSYARSAQQVMWYKLYKPDAFYQVLISQYAKEVSDYNYDEVANCKNLKELEKICKTYAVGQNQDVIIKCKTRLAWLIWEAKLRGYTLKPATLFSRHNLFYIDKIEPTVILMPLTSISGVAEGTAIKIYETINERPIESYEDMLERKDSNNKKIFSKRVLEGLGYYELTKEKIEQLNEFLRKHQGA